MNPPATSPLIAHLRTWLETRTQTFEEMASSSQYALWAFRHPTVSSGVLEFIDDATLSQGGAVVAMALSLDLPPIQSVQDAQALLEAAEWMMGINLVMKDFGSGGALMIQTKCPVHNVTEDELNQMALRLFEAKHYFED